MKLEDVDILELDNYANGAPHEMYSLLRREDPVHWHVEHDGGPGFWAITKHEDVKFVSKNPSLFSSMQTISIMDPDPDLLPALQNIMINMDPPRHNQYRNLINKGFTPRRVDGLEDFIHGVAKNIVDSIGERGECDFVEDVAALLPMTVICELFGIPESDRRYAYDLANRLIAVDDPEVRGGEEVNSNDVFIETFEFAARLAAYKREHPGDDLASDLLNGTVDGQPVDEGIFGAFVLLMIVAGNETTRTVTTNGMLRLIENPDQRQILIENPDKLPVGIEEMLRFDPGVHHFRRTATQDTEIRGTKILEGQKVVLWYASANRDEDVFDNPDSFDVQRVKNDHLTFGIGQHFCLGAPLARLQLRSILGEVLRRLPDMELTEPPRRLRSNFINGVKEMRVRFTPTK